MDIVASLAVAFIAGVGFGSLVVSSLVHKTLTAAKGEFINLRKDAEAKITEAENAIRRVPADIKKAL